MLCNQEQNIGLQQKNKTKMEPVKMGRIRKVWYLLLQLFLNAIVKV